MTLIDELRQAAQRPTSLFAAQLLKEDIARLERLGRLAAEEADAGVFKRKAMVLGWTQGDLRTFELDPELGAFLETFHAASRGGGGDGDGVVAQAWARLNKRRMDVLVGCLSRPRID